MAGIGARERLESVLRSIAVDLLGPDETDEPPAVSSQWLSATTPDAVARVCDAALDALMQELEALLTRVPPDVVRELERARVRHEAGFD